MTQRADIIYNSIIFLNAWEAYILTTVLVNGACGRMGQAVLKAVQDLGYKTLTVDTSEYRKLDGGLSCLSLRF